MVTPTIIRSAPSHQAINSPAPRRESGNQSQLWVAPPHHQFDAQQLKESAEQAMDQLRCWASLIQATDMGSQLYFSKYSRNNERYVSRMRDPQVDGLKAFRSVQSGEITSCFKLAGKNHCAAKGLKTTKAESAPSERAETFRPG